MFLADLASPSPPASPPRKKPPASVFMATNWWSSRLSGAAASSRGSTSLSTMSVASAEDDGWEPPLPEVVEVTVRFTAPYAKAVVDAAPGDSLVDVKRRACALVGGVDPAGLVVAHKGRLLREEEAVEALVEDDDYRLVGGRPVHTLTLDAFEGVRSAASAPGPHQPPRAPQSVSYSWSAFPQADGTAAAGVAKDLTASSVFGSVRWLSPAGVVLRQAPVHALPGVDFGPCQVFFGPEAPAGPVRVNLHNMWPSGGLPPAAFADKLCHVVEAAGHTFVQFDAGTGVLTYDARLPMSA